MSDQVKNKLPFLADIIFQYSVGSEGAEPSLTSLINAVQENANRSPVSDLVIRNPFNLQKYLNDKKSIQDIKAIDCSTARYNVEIQAFWQEFIEKRLLYYWAKDFAAQLTNKKPYSSLVPTVLIGITDFCFQPELPSFHNVYNITAEGYPDKRLTDLFLVHTIERCPLKRSTYRTAKPALRKWMFFIDNATTAPEGEMQKEIKDDYGLSLAYEKYLRFHDDESARIEAERELRREIDAISAKIDPQVYWKEVGLKEGRQEGRQEGRREGQEKIINSIIRCLTKRFPGQDLSEIKRRILGISGLDELSDLLDFVLDVPRLEDVLKRLNDGSFFS